MEVWTGPALMQRAMQEEMQKLFDGQWFCGSGGRKPLRVFRQNLPLPQDDDADVDLIEASAPYINVQLDAGTIEGYTGPQVVDVVLEICAYDDGTQRKGYEDVLNIAEKVLQWAASVPGFGGGFTLERPAKWAMQQDDSWPYYFGAVLLRVTTAAQNMDEAMGALV